MPDELRADEPMYVISVAARLVRMHPQTLRYIERAGLIHPTRSSGRIRLYSQRDIERLLKISRLTDELGVNLAGVDVILRLTERLEHVQGELEKHQIHLQGEEELSSALSHARKRAHPARPTASRKNPKGRRTR